MIAIKPAVVPCVFSKLPKPNGTLSINYIFPRRKDDRWYKLNPVSRFNREFYKGDTSSVTEYERTNALNIARIFFFSFSLRNYRLYVVTVVLSLPHCIPVFKVTFAVSRIGYASMSFACTRIFSK